MRNETNEPRLSQLNTTTNEVRAGCGSRYFFRRLYGLWFVGLSDTPSSLACA
jgi:hypothetical protein